jgi:hypothetical protein
MNNTTLTFNDGTTQTTAAVAGGVTSLNGQTGAITNTGHNTIGSYSVAYQQTGGTTTRGSTLAGTSLAQQGGSGGRYSPYDLFQTGSGNSQLNSGLAGTWRAMAQSSGQDFGGGTIIYSPNIWVRIS